MKETTQGTTVIPFQYRIWENKMSHKRILAILLAILVVTSISVAISAQDMEYNEAPMLAERVAAGELPPVAERLPDNPRVVEPIDSVGVYCGIWYRAWRGVHDFHCYGRTNYDPVLRWPRDPSDPVQPGLAERWEFNEDGTGSPVDLGEMKNSSRRSNQK